MKALKVLSMLMIILLIAAACASAADPEPTSIIGQPSQTPSASPSPTTKPTMTRRPTSSPTETIVVTPTNTPIFPVFTQHPFWETTPTSIATPEIRSGNYKLKEWTIENAIDLIHQTEFYVYAWDRSGLSGNRWEFQDEQNYTQFSVQEAFLFFPDNIYQKQLQWKLANIHAVQGDTSTDEWITQAIEDWINENNGYTQETLRNLLNEHGFNLDEVYTIPNLFGDGQDGTIIKIGTTHEFTYDGIFVSIREMAPGIFKTALVSSEWGFLYTDAGLSWEEDINGNGVPEVFSTDDCMATGCNSCSVTLVEWDEEQFENIIENGAQIPSSDGCYWELNQDTGLLEIIDYSPFSHEKYIFRWNGEVYEPVQTDYRYIMDVVYWHFSYYKDYQEVINQIEAYLNGTSASTDFIIYFEESPNAEISTDFLRFVLGLSYAHNGDKKNAKRVFQSLANSPTSPDYLYLSQAAGAFNAQYNGYEDIIPACKAVFTSLKSNPQFFDGESYNMDAIGLISYQLNLFTYCFPSKQSLLQASINSAESDNLQIILKNLGVSTTNFIPFDYWYDGHQDWVFIADVSGTNNYFAYLAIWYNGQWWIYNLDFYDINSTTTNITISQTSYQHIESPILNIQIDEELEVGFISKNDTSAEYQLIDFAYGFYTKIGIIRNDFIAEVYSFSGEEYESDYEEDVIEILYSWRQSYWDENQSKYIEGIYAEHLILEENRYEDAIKLLHADLAAMEPYLARARAADWDGVSPVRAQLLYLLGLAYQLNGNDTLAAQTYYQTWHDHPDTVYAIMARAKIEPAN